MLEEQKPDALIVVCMDCAHQHYVVEGLKHGLDVICEKPMTTNTEDALKIREAEKNSKGKVICTFNYRYNPVQSSSGANSDGMLVQSHTMTPIIMATIGIASHRTFKNAESVLL